MKQPMAETAKPWLILIIVIVVMLVSTVWAILFTPPHPPASPPDFPIFFTLKTVLTSVNATLLIILLVIYTGIYRRTRSKFSLGLLVFALAMLFQVLSSHPFIHLIFGYRGLGLGPFFMLPDFFTLVASVVLLYLAYS